MYIGYLQENNETSMLRSCYIEKVSGYNSIAARVNVLPFFAVL